VIAGDDAPHRFDIRVPTHAARQRVQRIRNAVRVAIGLRHRGLISVQSGEALNLHQLRLQVRIESEIVLHEQRMRIFVRHAIGGWNRRPRFAIVSRVGEQLFHHLPAVPRHLPDQAGGQKHRRFAVTEADRLAGTLFQQRKESRVLLRPVRGVKPLAV
jgi:hypothetical protein